MTWITAHPWITTLVGVLVTTGIPSLINEFKDPDNDPKTPPPAWVRLLIVLNNILAWRAADGTKGVFGTQWSVPLFHYPKAEGGLPGASGTVPPAPPSAILALILIPLLSACSFCKLEANEQQSRCILERNLIACGTQTGFQLLPIVLSVVGQAIAGHFDAEKLVSNLEAAGFQNIPCILAALQDYLLPGDSQLATNMNDALRLSLVKKGMHGEVVVQLRTGKIVKVIVP